MMNYEIITDTENEQYVVLQTGETTFKSFEAENENPNYISFLRQLSEDNPTDPHFLAWVEAGNTPEDFWSQSDDVFELPKEES